MSLQVTIEAAQRLQDQSYEQGAADERERIAAWLEKREVINIGGNWYFSEVADGIRDDIRNNEHNTRKGEGEG